VFNWFEHREAGNYLIFWWSGLGELELEAYIPEPEVPMITLTDADTGCDIVIDDGGWYYNNYQVLFPQASAEDVLGHLLVEYYDANGYFNYALVAVNSGFPLYLHLPVRPTSIRLSYVLDSGNTYLVDPKQWICLVDGSTQVENFDDWWYNSI